MDDVTQYNYFKLFNKTTVPIHTRFFKIILIALKTFWIPKRGFPLNCSTFIIFS